MHAIARLAVAAMVMTLCLAPGRTQDAGARLLVVNGPDGKPFATDQFMSAVAGADYLYMYADAEAQKNGVSSLHHLTASGLQTVKFTDGKPALFTSATHVAVGDGLYVRAKSGTGWDQLWWVLADRAVAVTHGDKPLPDARLSLFAAHRPLLLAQGDGHASAWLLDKAGASRLAALPPELASGVNVELFMAGDELLVAVDDGLFGEASARLWRLDGAAFKPVTLGGKPVSVQEVAGRNAGPYLYVGLRVEGRWQTHHYAKGALTALTLPDGRSFDSDIRAMQGLGGGLHFVLSEGRDKPSAAWTARGGKVEPMRAGETQLKSEGMLLVPAGERLVVMATDVGLTSGALWVHDGKDLKPLVGADGKPMQGRQPKAAWLGANFVLKLKDTQTFAEHWYIGRELAVAGAVVAPDGASLTDQNVAMYRGRAQLIFFDSRKPPRAVWRMQFQQ